MLFPKYILEDLSVGSGSIIRKSNIEEFFNHRDFYFRALGSLVVVSFPQLLSFSSVLSKPLSETLTSAGTAGCPTGQQL
jgi:hypothetical protein